MYGMTPIVRNAATLAHNIIYKYKDQLQAGILIAGNRRRGRSVDLRNHSGRQHAKAECLFGRFWLYIYLRLRGQQLQTGYDGRGGS